MHPDVKPFIYKPIENYKGLGIFSGEDDTIDSYATPILNVSDEEGDGNPTPTIISSLATSSTIRLHCSRKGHRSHLMMLDLITIVCEMVPQLRIQITGWRLYMWGL